MHESLLLVLTNIQIYSFFSLLPIFFIRQSISNLQCSPAVTFARSCAWTWATVVKLLFSIWGLQWWSTRPVSWNKECGWPGVFIYVFLLMRIIPKESVNNRVSTCFSTFKTLHTMKSHFHMKGWAPRLTLREAETNSKNGLLPHNSHIYMCT